MIETIVFALILAKIKGYKILPFFKTWTVYPFLFLELLHLYFQICIFLGNYRYVQYAPLLKRSYLFLFLIPIIVFKEYKEAIVGSLFVFAGTLLNNFVISQNGGKMPVYPNFSYFTGYVNPRAFEKIQGIHVLGGEDTKFWILSDIIDIGWSVLSIGDIFIRVLAFLVVYKTATIMSDRYYDKNDISC